jgi:DedD protein
MEEKNELNDIILNKGGSSASSKKVILAVATLGVILIIVVMLMNTLSSKGTENLPQAMLPPEPQAQKAEVVEEPLFEEVEVIQEEQTDDESLNKIAQKLKEESKKEKAQKVVKKAAPKKVVKKQATKKVLKKTTPSKVSTSGSYYVQVGSFSKYEPNKKFLDSILTQGYKYRYHKVEQNGKTLTKVLVGPFVNETEARSALRNIRSNIEAGAFLTKI